MGFDEFFRLHEHAAGAAGGVVDAAIVGGEHLDEAAHDAGWGVELAAVPALAGSGEADCVNEVDDFAEAELGFEANVA